MNMRLGELAWLFELYKLILSENETRQSSTTNDKEKGTDFYMCLARRSEICYPLE